MALHEVSLMPRVKNVYPTVGTAESQLLRRRHDRIPSMLVVRHGIRQLEHGLFAAASNLISDIGTFMQSVGAAWLMTSLTRNPLYIALIQTASALPFFLLALPLTAAN